MGCPLLSRRPVVCAVVMVGGACAAVPPIDACARCCVDRRCQRRGLGLVIHVLSVGGVVVVYRAAGLGLVGGSGGSGRVVCALLYRLGAGITRSGLHKKRPTGGKRHPHRKKRRHEAGRPSAATKLMQAHSEKSSVRVRPVRVRGGNVKWRALRLNGGKFSWATEMCTRFCRILDVVYNSTSNELVRTKTLVKGCVVQIDATRFRHWYYRNYGQSLGKKKKDEGKGGEDKIAKRRKLLWAQRSGSRKLDKLIEQQFKTGRLLARVSSRPGQVGRADGYILEGSELAFYMKKIERKKGGKGK